MKYLSLILFLFTTVVFADEALPGQWECLAFDFNERSYEAFGKSMQEAMHAAAIRCQRESKDHHCKVAQSFCDQGPVSLKDDRCVVSDETGRSWNTTGPDACRTAIELCNKWQFLNGTTADNSICTVTHP